ncbi:ricin-type beta-trefoil lectin domain protein [Streptomyces sp. NPDC002309]
MTRSVQQSGSDGEETATTAVATTVAPEPTSTPAKAKTGAEAGTRAADTEEAEETAPEGRTATEPDAGSGPGGEPDTRSGPEAGHESGTASGSGRSQADPEAEPGTDPEPGADPEAEPGAAAAAKSRLPALVRTMTATAIDRPQQQAGPVGRPGKAALAGAAVAGALLVSVPFLVLVGNDDKGTRAASTGGTVLGGGSQEAPGDFVVTKPEGGSPGDGGKDSAEPGRPAGNAPAGTSAQDPSGAPGDNPGKGTSKQDTTRDESPRGDTGQNDQPAKSSGDKSSDGDSDSDSGSGSGSGSGKPAAGAPSGVTFSAPVSVRSHLSGRCIDVPGSDFVDGKRLWVWDCNNSSAQKLRFASDGTVRIKDKCLDVANANFNNGTPIQLAWCNGNAAQKFVLNGSHDLVNTVVGKCVDIVDNNRGNGAWLQLWSCGGTDNQKWSV